MRQHPIPPVTEELQYRAIGVVRGVYEPADGDQLTRGLMRCADGTAIVGSLREVKRATFSGERECGGLVKLCYQTLPLVA
jgi:hypothetical protein